MKENLSVRRNFRGSKIIMPPLEHEDENQNLETVMKEDSCGIFYWVKKDNKNQCFIDLRRPLDALIDGIKPNYENTLAYQLWINSSPGSVPVPQCPSTSLDNTWWPSIISESYPYINEDPNSKSSSDAVDEGKYKHIMEKSPPPPVTFNNLLFAVRYGLLTSIACTLCIMFVH